MSPVNGRPSHAVDDPWRRTPTQERSRARVQRILLAADELLDEVGYDALSTRRVAERAGVPVATLYQFFADKQALVRAMASSHLERFATIIPTLTTRRWDGWRDGLHAALREFWTFVGQSRGFRDLWWGGHLEPSTLAAERTTTALLARQLQAFVETDARSVDDLPGHPRLGYVIAIEVADRLLQLAHRSPPADTDAILGEALHLMSGAIERELAVDRSGAGP